MQKIRLHQSARFDLASFDFQKDISQVVTSHVANQIEKFCSQYNPSSTTCKRRLLNYTLIPHLSQLFHLLCLQSSIRISRPPLSTTLYPCYILKRLWYSPNSFIQQSIAHFGVIQIKMMPCLGYDVDRTIRVARFGQCGSGIPAALYVHPVIVAVCLSFVIDN